MFAGHVPKPWGGSLVTVFGSRKTVSANEKPAEAAAGAVNVVSAHSEKPCSCLPGLLSMCVAFTTQASASS